MAVAAFLHHGSGWAAGTKTVRAAAALPSAVAAIKTFSSLPTAPDPAGEGTVPTCAVDRKLWRSVHPGRSLPPVIRSDWILSQPSPGYAQAVGQPEEAEGSDASSTTTSCGPASASSLGSTVPTTTTNLAPGGLVGLTDGPEGPLLGWGFWSPTNRLCRVRVIEPAMGMETTSSNAKKRRSQKAPRSEKTALPDGEGRAFADPPNRPSSDLGSASPSPASQASPTSSLTSSASSASSTSFASLSALSALSSSSSSSSSSQATPPTSTKPPTSAPELVNIALRARIREAVEARRGVMGLPNTETTMFRLVNREGDYLSGLSIDAFGTDLVVRASAAWAELHRSAVEAELRRAWGELLQEAGPLDSLHWQSDFDELSVDGLKLPQATALTATPENSPEGEGEDCDARVLEVKELGLIYLVQPGIGKKTGHFVDQRENRKQLRTFVQQLLTSRSPDEGPLRVLDLCCYSGGFALNAAAAATLGGGDTGGKMRDVEVVAVDVSPEAIDMVKRNAERNGVEGCITPIVANAFTYLQAAAMRKEIFDVVICDPPRGAYRIPGSSSTSKEGKGSRKKSPDEELVWRWGEDWREDWGEELQQQQQQQQQQEQQDWGQNRGSGPHQQQHCQHCHQQHHQHCQHCRHCWKQGQRQRNAHQS